MLHGIIKKNFRTMIALLTIFLWVGCGNTEGGSAKDDAGTGEPFVSNGAAGATLSIALDGSLSVANRVGFSVTALDPRGVALQHIRIFCESEKGIAIIEPSSGGVAFESTGSTGVMSGVLGGLLPGSYLLECRGPFGYNLVDRKTIQVTGTIPAEFNGFPGAAGGNLGGGLIFEDIAAQVTQIDFLTDPGSSEFDTVAEVDTIQNSNCDGDSTTIDPEPFISDEFRVAVSNSSKQKITITGVGFTVFDGRPAATSTFSVNVPIETGASGNVQGRFTDFSSSKIFPGTSFATIDGTYNVTFTLSGISDSGTTFTITGSTHVTFGGFNNCPA